MKRLITAGAAVVLIGLGIGTAAAQPPIPYGPVPEPRYEPVRRPTSRLLLGAGPVALERLSLCLVRRSLDGWRAALRAVDSRPLAVERLPLHLDPGALGLIPAQRSSTTTGT